MPSAIGLRQRLPVQTNTTRSTGAPFDRILYPVEWKNIIFLTLNTTLIILGSINMSLSAEEKSLVQEALQVYLQLVARQMPQQQVIQLAKVAENIIRKLDSVGVGGGKSGNKPNGITDEWYKKVCLTCDKLSPSGCTDKVTEKFPGKCDPILHFENKKSGLEKK
jgi:hypothetical protein